MPQRLVVICEASRQSSKSFLVNVQNMVGDWGVTILKPHSPYYLHPSNGPSALITAIVFDGLNYNLWEKAIHTALKAKNKLGFIDWTLERAEPNGNEDFLEFHARDIANSMIYSWIINVFEP